MIQWTDFSISSHLFFFFCTYKHKHVRKKSDQNMRLVWEEIADYEGRQIFYDRQTGGHSLPVVICAIVIAGQQGPPSDQQWLEWRGWGKRGALWSTTQRNKQISAQITTATSTVSSSASTWDKLSKTNDSSEGTGMMAGADQRFIWNDTALKTSLQMICGYSIHHLSYFRTIREDELHKYKEVEI